MIKSDRFDVPADVTYLNCANMAPRLHAVTRAGNEAIQTMATPWRVRAADWFSGAERVRTLAAQVMRADVDGVAIVPAASYGIAIAAANVAVERKQTIVLVEQEFPSNVYAWRALGARIVTVRPDTESVLGAIRDETAVVSIPNCHWTDGAVIDVEQVAARTREVGAALVIDASQSLGAKPIDVGRIQPDFLVAVGYKWLLGPYGLGYLYVAPHWREIGVPLERSWLARRGSEDFARLVDYTDDYRDGARRFDMGEFSQFYHAPMACAALEQILEWGVDKIYGALCALNTRLIERAGELGYAGSAGHFVGLRRSGGVPSALVAELVREQIYVSIRGDAIRVAPHLHTDVNDIDRLVAVLARHQ